jgi:hypothetical protein
MRTDAQIIAELKRRKTDGTLAASNSFLGGDSTPLDEKAITIAESRLGFALPPLLRAIYRDVSNGGFGDSYGFLGLINGPRNEDGLDAVSLYEAYRLSDPSDKNWNWPKGLLPLCHLGCAMYHCVQCDDAHSPIVWFEPNPHEDEGPWDDSFIPFCPSFNEYLSAWLDGVDLWAKLGDGAEQSDEREPE